MRDRFTFELRMTNNHKAGFVNIVGKPNVGKSTLCNALVGENLSIITHKAQTTRHRILGIISEENYQIVLSDTPGYLNPSNKLHEAMMGQVFSAFDDADILLLMVDAYDEIQIEENIKTAIEKLKIPVFLIINKIDLTEIHEEKYNAWKALLPNITKIFSISALRKKGLDILKNEIIALLPENPPYFDKEDMTDKSERFIVNEKVREKILLYYKEEIPYNVEVITENFKESESIIKIRTIIFAGRESHKNIIIGKNGSGIKNVGTEARKDLEVFFNKKIFLELHVKVRDNWKNDEKMLKYFGYKD